MHGESKAQERQLKFRSGTEGVYSNLCSRRQWNYSRLVLATPEGGWTAGRAKTAVVMETYPGRRLKPADIIQWVYARIGGTVQQLHDPRALSSWRRRCFAVTAQSDKRQSVCLLLVSSLTLPPFFFAALGVKFTGRVRFALTPPDVFQLAEEEESEGGESGTSRAPSTNSGRQSSIRRRTSSASPSTTSTSASAGSSTYDGRYFLFAAGHKPLEYGASTGGGREKLNFARLGHYLRFLAPDLSDVFMVSLALVNCFAVSSIFDLKTSPLQAVLHLAWTLVKYNVYLLLSWMLILSFGHRAPLKNAASLLENFLRGVCVTDWGRSLINDLHASFSNGYCYVTIGAYIAFSTLVYAVRRRFRPSSLVEPEAWSEWFRFNRPVVVLNPGRPSFTYRSRTPEVNPRVRALARQLGLDEDRIITSLPYDFLFDLPLWAYDPPPSVPLAADTQTQSVATRKLCTRCRCVKVLGLKRLSERLAVRPCSRCGYVGHRQTQTSAADEAIALHAPTCYQACSVCLEPYHRGELVCRLPCQHAYHRDCVFSWLLTDPHQTCPCCRWPAYAPKHHQQTNKCA